MKRSLGRRGLYLLLASMLLAVVAGCGPAEGKVSGEVKLKGQPLNKATILFETEGPKKKRTFQGRVENGKYSVGGIPVGPAKIAIISDPLPKEPVKKGDKWSHKSETNIPKIGTAKVEMKYTFDGEDETMQKIQVVPTFLIEGEKAGLTLKVDEKKSKGTVRFNNQDGKINDIRTLQVMSINVEMMGLSIPMTMEMDSHLKLKGGRK